MKWTSCRGYAIVTVWFLVGLSAQGGPIQILNYSFEIPEIDPITNPMMAVPVVPYWIELDVDTDPLYGGRNTGVFRNTEPNSPAGDHIVNADGNQLAFLGGQTGNAFLQELTAVYQPGKSYRLKVDVCPSTRYPPKTTIPMDTLVVALYDPNSADPNDLVTTVVYADEIISNELRTFSVYLPPVQPDDSWAGETIGIALRAVGTAGTIDSGIGPYWDLDNVRLTEYSRVPEFTEDSFVDFRDLGAMAADWLSCDNPQTDVTGEGCVDLEDLLSLTDFWLQHV